MGQKLNETGFNVLDEWSSNPTLLGVLSGKFNRKIKSIEQSGTVITTNAIKIYCYKGRKTFQKKEL